LVAFLLLHIKRRSVIMAGPASIECWLE